MPSRSRKRPETTLPQAAESAELAHGVFLERRGDDSRSGNAAFMVLRLVDALGTTTGSPKSDQGFRSQTAATEQLCRDQLAAGTETTHLLGIIESAADAQRARDP